MADLALSSKRDSVVPRNVSPPDLGLVSLPPSAIKTPPSTPPTTPPSTPPSTPPGLPPPSIQPETKVTTPPPNSKGPLLVPSGSSIFVKFGSEAFDLNIENAEVTLGGPITLVHSDFTKRFGDDKDSERIIVKYHRTSTFPGVSKSEPNENDFRIPCDLEDIKNLSVSFNKYKDYLQKEIDSFGETVPMEKNYLTIQRQKVELYLQALSKPPADTCIKSSETIVVTEIRTVDPFTNYYAVLPKIFYLLYQNAKGKKKLDTQEIFKEFPGLTADAKVYLDQLQSAGTFEEIMVFMIWQMGLLNYFTSCGPYFQIYTVN